MSHFWGISIHCKEDFSFTEDFWDSGKIQFIGRIKGFAGSLLQQPTILFLVISSPGLCWEGRGGRKTPQRLSQVPSLPKSNTGTVSVRLLVAFRVHAAYRIVACTVSSRSALAASVTGLSLWPKYNSTQDLLHNYSRSCFLIKHCHFQRPHQVDWQMEFSFTCVEDFCWNRKLWQDILYIQCYA